MRFLAAWLLLCVSCYGQIKIAEQKTQSWVGFDEPVVVNGIVQSGPKSKPVLAGTRSIIVVDYTGYEFITMYAEKIPSLERVNIEQAEGGYWFPSTIVNGKYRVLAIATATAKAPSIESLVVDVGGVVPDPQKPDPIPVPDPPKPDVAIRNEYGVGLAAYNAAGDAATAIKYAAIYEASGNFLFGMPSLKFIVSDNANDSKDPNKSVLAWMDQEQKKIPSTAKWDEWKVVMRTAFLESQRNRQFTRGDWYSAFNEVKDALRAVK